MKHKRIIWLMVLLANSIMSWGQETILTDNGDGTWILEAMPSYNVRLVVEYEDSVIVSTDEIFLTDNGDGTWTLDAMPAYNVRLVVELEDDGGDTPITSDDEIYLTDNGDGTWTLAAMPAYNVKLIVEYGTDEDAIGEIEASNANARDAIYNLSGQRVSTPGRGLYIINGKKILFK